MEIEKIKKALIQVLKTSSNADILSIAILDDYSNVISELTGVPKADVVRRVYDICREMNPDFNGKETF